MQDRFKCKVWSVEQKKMYSWSDCIKMGPNFIYGMFLDHRMLGKGIWLVRQCTGLKDKNGKLIYEGDIIKLYGKNYKVIFEKHAAYFGLFISKKETYRLNDIHTQTSEIEIIGNIYENPELLEEKQ